MEKIFSGSLTIPRKDPTPKPPDNNSLFGSPLWQSRL